jgi:uncharacterized delta-60 repeat protein
MRIFPAFLAVAVLWSCGNDGASSGPPGDEDAGGAGGETEASGGKPTGSAGTRGGEVANGGASGDDSSDGGEATAGSGGSDDFGAWSVDPTFGGEGVSTAGSGRSNDFIAAALRQSDGKVLVAGTDHPAVDMNGQVSGNVLVARLDEEGVLDESFGIGGIVRVPVGYRAQADTLEVQPDGKVIVVGQAHAAVANGAGLLVPFVLRLLPSGKLDSSFAEAGILMLSQLAPVVGSALQADGRILLVSGGPLQLARITVDGALDPTFGAQGIKTPLVDIAVGTLAARDVTSTSSGDIVIVGQTTKGQDPGDVLLARYKSDGTADDSFGKDGLVATPLGSQYDIGNAVASGPDGSIVVAGRATDTSQPCGAFGCPVGGVVLRYDSTGELDPSFGGGDGWLMIGGVLTQLTVLEDERLVAAGSGQVVTLLSDGTPDDSFGAKGISTAYNFARAAIAPDGSAILVTRVEDQGKRQAEVLATRLDSSGVADPDFGVAGSARFGSQGMADMALNVVEASDQTLLILGTTQSFYPLPITFAVSRHGSGGALDPSFGDEGFTTLESMVYGAELLRTADDKIVVVGTSVPSATWLFGVHRLDATGLHDDSFGTAGVAEAALIEQGGSHARAAALQADGKLVVAGFVVASNNYDLALLRLDEEGEPDPSFGKEGRVVVDAGLQFEQLHDVALASEGQIVALGSAGIQGSTVLLGRWNEDGSPDPSFGEEGLATPSLGAQVFLGGLTVQPDGKLLVAGYSRAPSGIIVARLLDDGSLDPSFAKGGLFIHEGPEVVPFGNWVRGPELVTLEDGSILVAGTRRTSFTESPVLLQLTSGGVLSSASTARARGSWTSFGATLLKDGQLLTIGRGFSDAGGTDYGLVRFTR